MIRFLEGTDEDGLGIPYPACKDSKTNNIVSAFTSLTSIRNKRFRSRLSSLTLV